MSDRPLDEISTSFDLESWSFKSASEPCLTKKILSSNPTTRWADLKPTYENMKQLDGLKLMSVTPDLSYLRIGPRNFLRSNSNNYYEVEGLDIVSERPSTCFEDITSRGPYLVLTSRKNMPTDPKARGRTKRRDNQLDGAKDTTSTRLGQHLNASECEYCSRERSRDDRSSKTAQANETSIDEDEISDESASTPLSEGSVEWNSAEESWSEASTDTEPDEKVPWKVSDSSDDSQSGTSDSVTESEDETSSIGAIHSYRRLGEDSDSDGRDIGFDCGSDDDDAYEDDSDFSDTYDSGNEMGMNSDEEDQRIRRITSLGYRPRRRATTELGLLTLYDLESGQPEQLFKFSHSLSVMLYKSPPVIHPAKPPVVWPLCRGEMLFADFEAKTYFIRRARPSTHNSTSVIQISLCIIW